METWNGSSITEFILLGLSDDLDVQIYLFMIFFLIYIATVFGNLLLVILCVTDPRLHTPMYFFLGNLALADIGLSTVIVPNMLRQFLLSKRISVSGCVIQAYTALVFGLVECVLLAVMAYDRYVAISSPLHYTVIMSKTMCITMAACCWIFGIVGSLLGNLFVLRLTLCESNIINHVCCEATIFIKMACSDTYVSEVVFFTLAVFALPIPCVFTMVSYARIIVTISRIRSSEGRHKAFSTCSSHFFVVTMFFSTAIFHYLRPMSKHSGNQDKILSLFYSVTPPLLNPLIYSMRNKDINKALQKLTYKIVLCNVYANHVNIK